MSLISGGPDPDIAEIHHGDDVIHQEKGTVDSIYIPPETYKELYYRFLSRTDITGESVVRLEDMEEIRNALLEGDSCLIRGNWRIGKSTMLEALKHCFLDSLEFSAEAYMRLPLKGMDVFRNEFGLREVSSLAAYMDTEFRDPESTYQHVRAPEIAEQIKDANINPFEYLNNVCSRCGKVGYIFIDELITFIDYPDIMKYLASLKDHSNLRMCMVLHHIGRDSNEGTMAEIFQGYSSYYVRKLTFEEAREMIKYVLGSSGIGITDEAVQVLLDYTGGRPMEINYSMAEMLDLQSVSSSPKILIECEDVQRFFSYIYKDEEVDFDLFTDAELGSAISNYIRIYESALNKQERRVVRSIVKSRDGVPAGKVKKEVRDPLLRLEIIYLDSDTNTYKINGRLFEGTIRNYLKNKRRKKNK